MFISKLLSSAPLPRLEAEILLAFVLQQSRTYLHTFSEQTVSEARQQQFLKLAQRRSDGEPIAYIVGEKEFWSLALKVSSDVLIPRPDTELLVELILQQYPDRENFYVADLGTGSGAIALALAKERAHWRITAVDNSTAALHVAQQNAQRLKLNNVSFLLSDWCEKLADKHYNVIVSNPPYIDATDSHLLQGDVRFEPRAALVADQNGLAAYEAIVTQATKKLLPQGYLFFEHGYTQAKDVQQILQNYNFTDIETFKDLAGHERVTQGKFSCV